MYIVSYMIRVVRGPCLSVVGLFPCSVLCGQQLLCSSALSAGVEELRLERGSRAGAWEPGTRGASGARRPTRPTIPFAPTNKHTDIYTTHTTQIIHHVAISLPTRQIPLLHLHRQALRLPPSSRAMCRMESNGGEGGEWEFGYDGTGLDD